MRKTNTFSATFGIRERKRRKRDVRCSIDRRMWTDSTAVVCRTTPVTCSTSVPVHNITHNWSGVPKDSASDEQSSSFRNYDLRGSLSFYNDPPLIQVYFFSPAKICTRNGYGCGTYDGEIIFVSAPRIRPVYSYTRRYVSCIIHAR